MKRVFLIVLDSLGVGALPDAAAFGDEGSNTLGALIKSGRLEAPNLQKLGLFNIDTVEYKKSYALGSYCRMAEASAGKDTTIGHWEIAGLISKKPFPTYPEGFPKRIIDKFIAQTGRNVLCNKPYSGTEVIKDYGEEHKKTGALIIYTSADSVFQIAAHEDVVPVNELYRYCEIARKILTDEDSVGRVIARPFIGEYPFTRTSKRHDFSLKPTNITMLDKIKSAGLDVIGVGKINDIFAGVGLTEFVRTNGNADGMAKITEYQNKDFNGLCFVNLVDFDMLYGHRNDILGYTLALNAFDSWLGGFLMNMKSCDTLIITADHGCDPSTPSTDHSREYIPMVIYGKGIKANVNLGTRLTYSDISATVLDILGISNDISGTSFLNEVKNA